MWSDRETNQDCLGYTSYVSVLSNICTHKDLAPLTLGIFGPWGSGKTSLMRMLMLHVANSSAENVKRKTLWFNAWMYEGREEAQSALVHAIIADLQKDVTLGQEVKQLVEKLKTGASVLKLSKFMMKSALTLTPNVDDFAACFKDESEKVADTMESFESDFRKLLELVRVDRIVVFIDDLDRCSSAKVIETFETIKLFLNTPACTFVIGVDADKIQQAVGEVYGVADVRRQKDYLEKIVQIPFSIPAQDVRDIGCYVGMLILGRHLDKQGWSKLEESRPDFYKHTDGLTAVLRSWVDSNWILYGDLKPVVVDDLEAVVPHVTTLARGLKGNPRQIKRFLNILSLRRQLVEANKLSGVKPDVLVKIAVLEYVWVDFFRILAETVDPATGTSELLEQLAKSAETEQAADQSPVLAAFLAEPGLLDFLLAAPQIDGTVDLSPYLFLAQTSLSQGQPSPIASVDEETRHFVRSIEGTDALMARAASRRAVAKGSAVASAVIRQLLADLPSAKDPKVIVNILGGLSALASAHPEMFKPIIKLLADLDGSNVAVALAALTLLEKASESGIEVPPDTRAKFDKAGSIASALAGPRSPKPGPRARR